MKKLCILILILIFSIILYATPLKPLTTAESSNYLRTTLYKDVIDFLFEVQKKSEYMQVLKLTTSTEGRMIPMVVISKNGIKSPKESEVQNKPVVLINANIHAGEIEGKEATLMLIRDIAYNKIDGVLDNQTILIIPIFNPDGNEKLGNNRRDNGPELAGTRFNGQFLDLNRDFTKLESPEVSALIRVFNEWNPVLFVDMHTTNGSYHREPVTYTTLNNPNTDQRLKDYMWNKFFPTVSKRLKYKYGYDSLPYGNFVDRANPELGWYNHAFEARYGTIYAGLRSILTVLNENYAHADFKTRVLSSLGFIKSILHYSDKHIKEMQKLVQTAELNTIRNYYKEKFILEYKNEKLFDVTIKSYVFKKEKIKPEDRHKYPPWIKEYIVQKTDKLKDYTVPYFTNPIPTRSVSLPGGYILLPNHSQVVNTLKNHGIIVEKIRKKIPVSAENFVIKELKLGKRLYQGHVLLEPKGEYAQKNVDIPAGSYYISMKQPLARIIAVLLEPESTDSLISWGFFNREIVTQWSNKPKEYPVYRIGEQTELSLERIQY